MFPRFRGSAEKARSIRLWPSGRDGSGSTISRPIQATVHPASNHFPWHKPFAVRYPEGSSTRNRFNGPGDLGNDPVAGLITVCKMANAPLRNRLRLLIIALLVILAACDPHPQRQSIDLSKRVNVTDLRQLTGDPRNDAFKFGFDIRNGPEEDARQYLPFLVYLSKSTGYRFELHFSPIDGEIVEALGDKRVDFAAIGAGSFIQARMKRDIVPLVLGLNSRGEPGYQSIIVTRPDSPLSGIEELPGHRFGFGSITSTQGHLIPRIILAQHGLSLADLAGHEYFGSHGNCANAVITGKVDVYGMQDTLARKMVADGDLKILFTSDNFPSSGIAARGDLPKPVLATVRNALLDFQPRGRDAPGLYHWERTEMANGFTRADEENYAELRKWALKLGIIRGKSP